jgi:aspartate 1-decarboxylase
MSSTSIPGGVHHLRHRGAARLTHHRRQRRAARLVRIGDKVIIVAYCQIPAEEARNYRPSVVVLGEGNAVERAA